VPFLFEHVINSDFVIDLIQQCRSFSILMEIFAPVINNLNSIVRHCQLLNDEYREPLVVLRQLCEIKINNARPICEIVSLKIMKKMN
jgi:ubiquitin conjugation factor E4 B